jgi:hypothetical protein
LIASRKCSTTSKAALRLEGAGEAVAAVEAVVAVAVEAVVGAAALIRLLQ